MNCEELYAYCQSLPYVTSTFPFDDDTLTMQIGGKIFALMPLDKPDIVLLKCDPERAIELRERYSSIQPGWHMNKKHWNMVVLNGGVPTQLILELVRHSYDLVMQRLPKKVRTALTES